MKAITVPAPLGTLLTTKRPCPTCERYAACEHEIDAGQAGWGCDKCGASGYRYGTTLHDERTEHPMVAQWITVEEPPPDGVIGQRVIIRQGQIDHVLYGGREYLGEWALRLSQNEWQLRSKVGVTRIPVPLDRVVGSGVIAECLPILAEGQDPNPGGNEYVAHVAPISSGALWWWKGRSETENLSTGRPTWVIEDISDQLPFNDWSPGRWALRVERAAPTTERCPWCWGCAVTESENGSGLGWWRVDDCPVCAGAARLDPFRVSGRAGWSDFDPSMVTP